MATNSIGMKQEVEEMKQLLLEIQGETSKLLGNNDKKMTKRMTASEKRNAASSSWAKSTASRMTFSGRSAGPPTSAGDDELDLNVEKSERAVKTRAAAYTIGKRPREQEDKKPGTASHAHADSVSPFYDYNIDVVSTHKRVKGVSFPKAVHKSSVTAGHDDSDNLPTTDDGDGKMDENTEEKTEKPAIRQKHKDSLLQPSSKAYSFPKSKRDHEVTTNITTPKDDIRLLDVERGEKWLRPQAPAAIIRPESKPVMNKETDESDSDIDDHYREGMGSQGQPIPSINYLSSKPRTPAWTIPEVPKAASNNVVLAMKNKSTPGPGDYAVEHHFNSCDPKSMKGGTVYRPTTKPTKHAMAAQFNAPKLSTPGPGFYAVEKYYEYTRPVEHAVRIIPQEVSESKITPQLERKHYWEEKRRDLREDHDHCRVVNDAMLHPRVSTATMHPATPVGVDWRNRKILRQRAAEKDRLAQGRVYEVNHTLVEKRTSVRVDMKAELLVQEKLQKQLQDKPGLRKVKAEKIHAEQARETFYGPQLPVDWVADRRHVGHGDPAADDNDDDEDMDDVLHFLANRRGGKHTVTQDPHHQAVAATSATALAFLRSSYSAAPVVAKSAVMRPETAPSKLALAKEMDEREHEFLGPQLMKDWVAEADSRALRHKAPAVRMSIGTGRDELIVNRKGQVLVKKFNEPTYLGDESSHLGPGVYATSRGLGLGDDVKGVVPFEKLVARRDAIGPFGEKSEAAAEELHEAIGDDFYRDNPLDYEAGQLREIIYGRVPTFELYKTERPGQGKEKPPEYPAQEKLGGTWFEGMAEVVAKQRPVVRIDRMTGRDDHAADDAVLDEAADGGLKGLEAPGGLDIDHINDALTRPRASQVVFADPIKQPRWAEPPLNGIDEEPVRLILSPKKPQKRIEYVDMNRQGGSRWGGNDDGGDEAMQEITGVEDPKFARQLAYEREEAVLRGKEMTGKGKADNAGGVDMGRQKGRDHAVGPPKGHMQLNVDGEVVDTHHVLDLDPGLKKNDPAYAWGKAKAGGVGNWAKEPTKHDQQVERDLDNEYLGAVQGALDINPDPTTSSRYQKTPAGAVWTSVDRPSRPGAYDTLEESIKAQEQGLRWTEHPTLLSKIHSSTDIGVTGGQPGRGKSTDWSKGTSKTLEAMMDGSAVDPLLTRPTLIIEPNPDASSDAKKIKSGARMSRSANGRNDAAAAQAIIEAAIGHPPDVLALEPDDGAMKKRLKGGAGMKPSTNQSRSKQTNDPSAAPNNNNNNATTKSSVDGPADGNNDKLKRSVTFSSPSTAAGANANTSASSTTPAPLAPISPLKSLLSSATQPPLARAPPTLSPARLTALDEQLERLSLK